MAPHRTSSSRSGRASRPLAQYQQMRDFDVTAEPRGKARSDSARPGETLPFVVQKHAASRLHYDFRLGWNGVLKSWAVTKGPSYFPGDKRLAVQVEDHPWEYRDFEGTIPKGQYGGGTVMVWDQGNWTPLGDVDRGLAEGHLKFALHGKKLKGNWALVRMHGRARDADKPNWLLIKERDEFAGQSSDKAITEEAPNSAATRRSIAQISAQHDRVWNSNGHNASQSQKVRRGRNKTATGRARNQRQAHSKSPIDLRAAPKEHFPRFIPPQLAEQTATPPKGSEWVHEIKLDGYRIQLHLLPGTKNGANPGGVKLLTRKGLNWTSRMPDIAAAATAQLNAKAAILDGEAVALGKDGISSFADLQAAFQEGRERFITYFAFDLLHLDGHNLRGLPLSERKRALALLLNGADKTSPIRLSEDLNADGSEVFKNACTLGAEGIISKLSSAKYNSGRSGAWLKSKCRLEQEFVIGAFTMPSKGTTGVGALLLGYYERGKLRYAGRAGTGFTRATHKLLRGQLEGLEQTTCPFADIPRQMRRGAHWVKPQLVTQIQFSTWTRDNLVRQAAFKGLREDKPAAEVTRESTVAAANANHRSPRVTARLTQRDSSHNKHMTAMSNPAITHPDKVLDRESGMTKGQLAEYYEAIAEHLLPHIADRPLSVVRCPDGNGKPCFFQKHIGAGLPTGVKSVSIRDRKSQASEEYLAVDTKEGLVGLAQMGVLEIHPWGSHSQTLEQPDRIVFDLDPDTAIDWETLAETARLFRRRLKRIGLESFVKSTGGKGLHVVLPIRPDHQWPIVKDFAHAMALRIEGENPTLYITKMTKASRKDRIYLDYLRNDRGATAVAPYSPRARSGAPVAMPLSWNELKGAKRPMFHVLDFEDWKSRLQRDPWRDIFRANQSLSPAAAK